jgi:hypothetical protein
MEVTQLNRYWINAGRSKILHDKHENAQDLEEREPRPGGWGIT